jgi:hypothetical protein
MRLAVESWAPDFGSPMDDGGGDQAPSDLDVEVAAESRAPITPTVAPAPAVVFVDGVRRVEARVRIEPPGRPPLGGICASYAAGAVRCDGKAVLVEPEVRRGLFCREGGPDRIVTPHGTFGRHRVVEDDTEDPMLALQYAMADLEADVSERLDLADDELLVVDGPLSKRRAGLRQAVGYVKTHRSSYLTPPATDVMPVLDAGQRTPLFRIGTGGFQRWSWYLRLPGPRDHDWWGVVRCEVNGDRPLPEARAVADRTAATLPRFASEGHKDPRAPQNLYPIGGLEKELKHLLGDPGLWYRALREAVAA